MIKTAFNELLGIKHPVAQAGMAGDTSPELVAAICNAGGLGILGVGATEGSEIPVLARAIRDRTNRPFGLNLLLHGADEDQINAVLEARPSVLSTAWPRDDQDLTAIFGRAHEHGIKVMHMVPTVPDATQAAAAGADMIVAQGTDGGGHIGLVGTVVIVPMVVSAVAPVPVLAAGGIADGRGLAAMLAFGAAGVLIGTRFLATVEAPAHEAVKQLIVRSDGTDTVVTDLADIMLGVEWPGAVERLARNRVVERWLGRANDLRRRRHEVVPVMREARRKGDIEEAVIYYGQSAGLIHEIVPAGQVVADIVRDAETILRQRLLSLVAD
ncbi:MAG: NAD(P)H-dependent flavin oxidoreductase [Candidatus Dormibacteraceae bacterium]